MSGSLPVVRRPQLLQAISALRRSDVLVVQKRDRLGRDVVVVAMIEQLVALRGARIISCAGEGSDDDTPTGALVRGLMDLFAAFERQLISQRTSAAMQAKKRRGELVGAVPWGMVYLHGTLKPEPGEQAILELILDCRSRGLSMQRTADYLNERGHTTRTGGRWYPSYVTG
jgi:DNA invertase Pin-like site-specific DNA recombinase